MEDATKIAEEKMKKAVDVVKKNFAGVRTGRASPALLDQIKVEYYGTQTPLKQLASVSVPEPTTLMIQAYDKNAVSEIEKAINKSDLGLPPNVDGGIIRLNLPKPTEERRKELVKVIKKEGEDGKVALRNVRRDAMEKLKAAKNKKEMSEDMEKNKEEEIGKFIGKYTEEIDKLVKAKEKEIMEV